MKILHEFFLIHVFNMFFFSFEELWIEIIYFENKLFFHEKMFILKN